MPKKLDRQVFLITGASWGSARRWRWRSALAARVALLARRVDRLEGLARSIRAGEGQALALAADVTRDGDVEAAVARTVHSFGRVDVAVANAGLAWSRPPARLELETTGARWRPTSSACRTIYATVDQLKATRGVLASIGSVNRLVGPPGTSASTWPASSLRGLAEAITEAASLRRGGRRIYPASSQRRAAPWTDSRESHRRRGSVPDWLVMPRATAARRIARANAARRRELGA